MKTRIITIKDVTELLKSLKRDIGDEYRAQGCEDETTPSMDVTVGATPPEYDLNGRVQRDGGWDYQTGDNSFTGGAYGHPFWGTCVLTRRANCTELARQICEDINSQHQDSLLATP